MHFPCSWGERTAKATNDPLASAPSIQLLRLAPHRIDRIAIGGAQSEFQLTISVNSLRRGPNNGLKFQLPVLFFAAFSASCACARLSGIILIPGPVRVSRAQDPSQAAAASSSAKLISHLLCCLLD